MPGITLKNGLISYYGNPAGYTEKDRAVVDSMFCGDELESWLSAHSLTPAWTDGVMERLIAGGQTVGEVENAAPLKNVRIWQLKPDTDVHLKFIGLDELKAQFGLPSPDNYRVAYDGQLGTNDLESIYERCNINHPPGYSGHSLSMSDVVELYDATGSEFHYCDHFGFAQIKFAPEQPTQDMTMSQSF